MVPSDFVSFLVDLVLLQDHLLTLLVLSVMDTGTSQTWNLAVQFPRKAFVCLAGLPGFLREVIGCVYCNKADAKADDLKWYT